MGQGICPESEFIELIKKFGPLETARRLNINQRAVFKRRRNIERKFGKLIEVPRANGERESLDLYPGRVKLDISDGIVLVCGDAHYWPGPPSTAHRAFVQFCKELKPRAVIMNGDALDGSTISRHAKINWENRPNLVDEIEAVKDRLHEIELATPKGAPRVWNLGNHDGRFETRLANTAPEYAEVEGVHLKDHFPLWEPAWATWINDDVVIKHRYKGGIHATRNNTLSSGKTTVTNHLHSAKVTPFTDYNGTRWGVDTGCIADIYAEAFTDYTEDNPRDWRAGFCVLTFYKRRLLQPELALVFARDHVEFRGKVIRV